MANLFYMLNLTRVEPLCAHKIGRFVMRGHPTPEMMDSVARTVLVRGTARALIGRGS